VNPLDRIASRPHAAGLFLDFDGSLSEIVHTPEAARPVAGAREVLADLALRYRLVAVVSGRRTEELVRLIGVEGISYEGLYGLEAGPAEAPPGLMDGVEGLAQPVPGARVEEKGLTVAVHYRNAPDPEAARRWLFRGLAGLATDSGMELIEGKMVLELVPAGESRKRGAIRRLAERAELEATLYAGDDLPDLEAFEELDRLAGGGTATMKVAVAGRETPDELVNAADLVVDGPAGLVELLRSL
jgi:trehalose 6-phosphate phosphatase